MTELNKTEKKYLARIEKYLDDIQAFIDLHIQNSNTMTAAEIADGFCKENDCDLSQKDFVASFRVALRENKITGIQNAGRAGYRREGTHSKSKDDQLEDIALYLDDLQAFVDLYIQGDNKMTAAAIYTQFKKENGCDLEEEVFIKAFRLAIKEGLITGLESAYRYGYKRIGTGNSPSSKASEDEDNAERTQGVIQIDENRRVVSLDRFCWAIQTRKESGIWTNEGYYGNVYSLIRGIARKLIDLEFKTMDTFNMEELEVKFQEVEIKLADLLNKAINPKTEDKAA